MTKTKLLLMIKQSTLSAAPDTAAAYGKYYPLIEANLQVIPDSFELSGLSSLEEFDETDAFERFVRDASPDEIERKLEAILTDVRTCANMYVQAQPEQTRRAVAALTSYTKGLDARQSKNHKIVFPIIIAFLIVLSIVVVTFSVLQALELFDVSTSMGKACAIIPAVAGALDFVAGLTFFLYERHDDSQKKAMRSDLDGILGVKVVNSGNKVKGNGNNFGIINYGADKVSESDKEAELERFIDVCNVGNKVNGDGNNFGIINKK